MQQSPCFKSFSPDENPKIFHTFQPFNNTLCSPRTLFYGLGLSSSGQNSYSKKNMLSKIKYSNSNTKQFYNNSNKPFFLSNKRHLSESAEKNNIARNSNYEIINKIEQPLNTEIKKGDSIIETIKDVKITKASSKKNSSYIPAQLDGANQNYNIYNYGYCNNYNCGYISNSSFARFNTSTYIGSVKKNLLPSLSKEFKSNKKQKNIKEKKVKFQNNISFTTNKNNKNNNFIESQKKNKSSCSKININTSGKKTSNESTAYDILYKITESLDLEEMVDYIVSSTKRYKRYNDNKENYSNNNPNNINQNETFDNNNGFINNYNSNYYINSEKKNNKNNKNNNCNNNSNAKSINSQTNNHQIAYSICKCKKVECLKYSCSCLKSGNKCGNLCSCVNCKNKGSNILFKNFTK